MALTLAGAVHSELLVKKSRFLACVQPVPDRAAALAVVQALRAEHPGAAHVCWALLAGGQSAANDDGEPGGTAGRPMLEVLRHQQLEGVLATVVRYFGGVKLGAGGLVRRVLQEAGAPLGEVRHGEAVEIAFSVAEDAAAGLRVRLDEAGQGQLRWIE